MCMWVHGVVDRNRKGSFASSRGCLQTTFYIACLHVLFSFMNIGTSYSQFFFIPNQIQTWKLGEVQIGSFQHRFQFQRMENSLKHKRMSCSDPQSQKHHGSSGSGNDKAWNWFQRTNFHDDDKRDDEHVTAVAAAAFSMHSLEEAELLNLQKKKESPKISRTQTTRGKDDNISRRPSYGETSVKRPFGQDARTTGSAFPVRHPSGMSSPRHISSAAGYQKQNGIPIQHKNDKAKAEAWERAKIAKIQKWYEKIKSQILSWESEKKIQARLQVERKKSELEHRRAIAIQHYKNKVARIDMTAQGAIAQLEDQRRKEESEAKRQANKIQKSGRVPVKCFCFKSF